MPRDNAARGHHSIVSAKCLSSCRARTATARVMARVPRSAGYPQCNCSLIQIMVHDLRFAHTADRLLQRHHTQALEGADHLRARLHQGNRRGWCASARACSNTIPGTLRHLPHAREACSVCAKSVSMLTNHQNCFQGFPAARPAVQPEGVVASIRCGPTDRYGRSRRDNCRTFRFLSSTTA